MKGHMLAQTEYMGTFHRKSFGSRTPRIAASAPVLRVEWLFRIPCMPSNWIFWVVFNVFVLAMLALDLGVFHRKKHVVGFREAIGWTSVWIGLAGSLRRLDLLLRAHAGGRSATRPNSQLSLEFVTGYLIEQSLSVDNLFVFLLIFRYFSVPQNFSTRCCSGEWSAR